MNLKNNQKIILTNKIYKEDSDVNLKLALSFGVTKAELLKVVQEAANAWYSCSDNDPLTCRGITSWQYGVRFLRELFLSKEPDWIKKNEKNVPMIENPNRKLRITFQNVNMACDPMTPPRLLHKKGNFSEHLINNAQYDLFDHNQKVGISDGYQIWYLCSSIQRYNNLLDVRAELSRPGPLLNGQFNEFRERIFILQKSDEPHFKQNLNEEPPTLDPGSNVTGKFK